jgi:hypothetical protein
MSATQYIGNGDGFIYITDNVTSPTNQDILTTIDNDCQSVRGIVYQQALASASLYANKSATSDLSVTSISGVGNITAVTINAVSQIGSSISVSGLTTEQLADAIASSINAFTPSGPDYKAVAIGSSVSIIAPQDQGSGVNGLSVIVSNDDPGNIDVTATDLSGGANSNDLIDSGCGRKFFINPDFDTNQCAGKGTAVEGDLTNSVEISSDIIFQGLQGSLKDQTIGIVSEQATPLRISSIQVVYLQAEVGFTDNIKTINTEDFSENDIVYFKADPDYTITFLSSFVAAQYDTIVLQKKGSGWNEVSRSGARLGDTADYRASGFPFPIEGSTTSALPTSGGFSIETGVATVIQRYTGNVTLTGNLSISFSTTGAVVDGDEVWVFMDGTVDLGNTFTINGEQLSDTEALTGGWVARAKFNGTTWDHFVTYRLGDTTTWRLDVGTRIENGGIGLEKLETSIRTELITAPVSLDASELGKNRIIIPYDCTVTSITSYSTKLIEATDDASIIPQNNASLVMTDGTMTMIAGSPIGTGVTATPTGNNIFSAGDTMTLVGTKTTPGGKVLVSITVVRS